MRSITRGLFVLLVGIFLCNIVYAQQQDLGTFKENEDAFLIQICSNCTFVNITTITLGDKSNVTFNVAMNKDGTFYSFVLDSNYTSSIGTYIVNGVHDLDGIHDIFNYRFKVTPLGLDQTTSQGIGSFGFLILMFSLMVVFGFIGFKLLKTNWWILGIFLIFFSSILLVYDTYLGFEYHTLFTGLSNNGMPETLFWILLAVIVVGFLAGVALLTLKWREVLRYVKKEVKRKEEKDEDFEDWDVDQWNPKKK